MKSPLGAYYEDELPAPRRRHVRLPSRFKKSTVVGLAVLSALPAINSTFAAQISLGSQSTQEFGQGAQALTACDSSITIALGTEWYQTDTYFRLSSITLSDLDTTAAACLNKTLTVKVRNSTGDELDLNGPDLPGNALTYTVTAPEGPTESRVLPLDPTIHIDSTLVATVSIETV